MTLCEEKSSYKCAHGVEIYNDDVLNLYDKWECPTVIISDGPYGLNSFFGDCKTPKELVKWYEPHIKAWSERTSHRATTLWFWNSEIGWATVHPILEKHGWVYVRCNIWNKGISHVAGNTNTQRLREFPCVTEVCVQYVREVKIGDKTFKEWLREEWERTGLPLYKANEAAGVANAASRKWLTKDYLWYPPPYEGFKKLAEYANLYGDPNNKPYFTWNGLPLTREEYAKLVPKFYCKAGVTNVWSEPPLHNSERIKVEEGGRSVHLNQKPLKLMRLIIEASSDKGDVIWEPFGGLCSAAIAAHQLGRRCYSAEKEKRFYDIAVKRLKSVCSQALLHG